jgi:hypothetical protein
MKKLSPLDPIKFLFVEELALKNSFYSIGVTVLEYATKLTSAHAGVFLYSPPGVVNFEKIATVGLSKQDDENWSRCSRNSDLPLPNSIRSQKIIEVGDKDQMTLIAFPLNDSDISSAGFSISFSPGQKITAENKDFLVWLARKAEIALFNKDGEGV